MSLFMVNPLLCTYLICLVNPLVHLLIELSLHGKKPLDYWSSIWKGLRIECPSRVIREEVTETSTLGIMRFWSCNLTGSTLCEISRTTSCCLSIMVLITCLIVLERLLINWTYHLPLEFTMFSMFHSWSFAILRLLWSFSTLLHYLLYLPVVNQKLFWSAKWSSGGNVAATKVLMKWKGSPLKLLPGNSITICYQMERYPNLVQP